MKRSTVIVLLLLAAGARAQPPGGAAEAAMREGFPQAAIDPLEDALKKASPGEKAALGALLARAYLAQGRAAEALKTLDAYCGKNNGDTEILRAAALAGAGKLGEAAALAAPRASKSDEAALLLARIRWEQGDPAAAREALDLAPLETSADLRPNAARLRLDLQLDAEDFAGAEKTIEAAREQNLFPAAELDAAEGRVRLGQNRPSDAAEAFGKALASGQISASVRDNARLGLARALVTLGVNERARAILREGIAETPGALTARQSMEQWLALEKDLGADPSADLQKWATEKGTKRATEAALALARYELDSKNAEQAISAVEPLAKDDALDPYDSLRARFLLAEARIAAGHAAEALRSLEQIRTDAGGPSSAYRLADLRARALAAIGDPLAAHNAFVDATKSARTPEQTASAAANALLCALAADDVELARKAYAVLLEAAPASPDLIRWSFLLATAEANKGNIDGLSAIARNAPSADYAFQAKLALAEWRLARGEAEAAQRILRTAREDANTEDRAASLAAAEVFAADNAGSQSREDLLKACEGFLAKYPHAPEASDIAFKMAELHSRAGDHAAAESVLSGLAQSLKDPSAAELAKFLAAQSAARSMSADGASRALTWFDDVAQGSGSLRHRARFEQASLLLRQRRYADALTLYDRLLSSSPAADVRRAALMEKGDTLSAMGTDAPAKLSEAAAVYAALAAEEDAPPDWRDQAACKNAAVLAKAGRTQAALAAYRAVLSRRPDADYFWFYKAGLEAGQILEEERDWPAAIAVYDQVAAAGGPQREELAQRSRRLRLEHFIWEN